MKKYHVTLTAPECRRSNPSGSGEFDRYFGSAIRT
ncbi:hypothetical protein Mnod_2405 [Methylobacterium nodulans ORS 2060]|uniref:Uncharacterized protein n=1 Tax=Methylobacterium nodulans (strain LMG 21967 / CNCM I-2342 / ORS 2060) TaxID=460265 RepID=B8IBG2_METNO|nr:hypothetical protein Mnod_2405 [Methylobacterium nodulans ORS 2060]